MFKIAPKRADLPPDPDRWKKAAWGFLPMLVVVTVMLGVIFLGHTIPGVPGEILGKLAGLMWSPFLLEGSLLFLGFMATLVYLNVRRKMEGDEYVSLEIPDDPDDGPA